MLQKLHWKSLSSEPLAGTSMLTIVGRDSDYKRCLMSQVFKSLITSFLEITHYSYRQKLIFFGIVRETHILLSFPWSIDGTLATDSELCSLKDEGIQEGREVGGKHGVAVWLSPSHTLCISIQVFPHFPFARPIPDPPGERAKYEVSLQSHEGGFLGLPQAFCLFILGISWE